MKVVVLQSSYLPWKGYFDLIHDSDIFVFYDEVKYTKNDWRNRNKIYTPNGIQWLTVPISSKFYNSKISEVIIQNDLWQKKHFKAIYLSYNRSPFFWEIKEFLENIFLNQTWFSLKELNHHLIKCIIKMLGINTKILDSKDFIMPNGRVERLISLLKQVGATTYISGPKGKNYIDTNIEYFKNCGIECIYKDYSNYPVYPQNREIFDHYVTILDLIVNVGIKNTSKYIWGF